MSGSIFEDDQISGFDDLVASDIVDDVPRKSDSVDELEADPVDQMSDSRSDEDLDAAEQSDPVVARDVGDSKVKSGVIGRVRRFDWSTFTVFDAMLLISLLCISLATLWLFFELRNFGEFPFAFPWRTPGF